VRRIYLFIQATNFNFMFKNTKQFHKNFLILEISKRNNPGELSELLCALVV